MIGRMPTSTFPWEAYRDSSARAWISFPRWNSYLVPDCGKVAEIRQRYRHFGEGVKVGISWRSGNRKSGRRRTASLEQWQPVLRQPDVHFVNVQYGDCREELEAVRARFGIEIHHDDSIDPLQDLDGFAGGDFGLGPRYHYRQLDGAFRRALGRPVWTLVSSSPNWRWFRGRSDSPWYPTMRLFRQPAFGEWESVFDQTARELNGFCDSGT